MKDLKEGKLFQFGLTAGVSFAAHTGAATKNFTGTDSGAMPYLALFPVQAVLNQIVATETNEYCSAVWLGSDSTSALKTVRDNAAARLRLKDIVTDDDTKQQIDAKIERETGWKVKEKGRCGFYRYIGVYVGLPTGDISGSVDSREQKAKASISYGLAIAPISYLTLLIGRTHLNYAPEGGDRVERQVLTLGLGGTLDIASLLIPSK